MKNLLRNEWRWFLVVSSGLLGGLLVSRAATYNFHFNSTEQGDNSTATPTVIINDDLKSKAEGTPTTAASGTPTSSGGSTQTSSIQGDSPTDKAKPTARWGLNVSWAAFATDGHPQLGALFSLHYLFTDDFGVRALIGSAKDPHVFTGAELMFMPWHIPFGKFDLVDLGMVGGLFAMSDPSGARWAFLPDEFEVSMLPSIYAGATGTLHLSKAWGLQASFRASTSFALGDVGVTMRF